MKERICRIDALKFFAAFLVICLHIGMPKSFYNTYYIKSVCQIAVPIFFICSGYFFDENKKISKSLIKLLKIFCISFLLYFLFGLIYNYLTTGESAQIYLNNRFSIGSILKLLFFNDVAPTMYAGRHLWYLLALIYILIIEKVAKINNKWMIIITVVLLVVNLLLGSYSMSVFNREFAPCLTRNFLLMGIPMFNIGRIIANYYKENNTKHINKIMIVVFLFLLIAETFLNHYIIKDEMGDLLLSTIALAVILFCSVLQLKETKQLCKLGNYGKNYGLYIYIIHPMIILCLEKLLVQCSNDIFMIVGAIVEPVIILTISILISKIILGVDK